MPSSLHFLDGKSRDQITTWLHDALQERVHVPREYHDQPIPGAISSAAPGLGDSARADLNAATLYLLAELQKGRHPHPYLAALLRLVTDLELRDAVPILRKLASTIPALKDRLGWESCSDLLFCLLNLRDLHDEDYWLSMWEHNKRCFAPVTLAALFDLDPVSALGFLPQIPNSAELGDLAALTLDNSADHYQGHERTLFREAAATAAIRCKRHVRDAIENWLEETATASQLTRRNLARLHEALGPLPESYQRTPAKLCEAAA